MCCGYGVRAPLDCHYTLPGIGYTASVTIKRHLALLTLFIIDIVNMSHSLKNDTSAPADLSKGGRQGQQCASKKDHDTQHLAQYLWIPQWIGAVTVLQP